MQLPPKKITHRALPCKRWAASMNPLRVPRCVAPIVDGRTVIRKCPHTLSHDDKPNCLGSGVRLHCLSNIGAPISDGWLALRVSSREIKGSAQGHSASTTPCAQLPPTIRSIARLFASNKFLAFPVNRHASGRSTEGAIESKVGVQFGT